MIVRRMAERSESSLRLRSHPGANTAEECIAFVRRRAPTFANVHLRAMRLQVCHPAGDRHVLLHFSQSPETAQKNAAGSRHKTWLPPSEVGAPAGQQA